MNAYNIAVMYQLSQGRFFLYIIDVWAVFYQIFSLNSGMADFQLLPPGVNKLDYKGLPVDHTLYQVSG